MKFLKTHLLKTLVGLMIPVTRLLFKDVGFHFRLFILSKRLPIALIPKVGFWAELYAVSLCGSQKEESHDLRVFVAVFKLRITAGKGVLSTIMLFLRFCGLS